MKPPIDLWQAAHPSRWRRGSSRRRIKWIVLHETDGHGDSRATAARWATAGEDGTCAHFAIGQDGFTVQAVHLADVAFHAHDANATSVGIELCARAPRTLGTDDAGMPPSTVQLARGAGLIAWLCWQLRLDATRSVIVGHAEVDFQTTHTGCPKACGLDLDAMVESVRMVMAA